MPILCKYLLKETASKQVLQAQCDLRQSGPCSPQTYPQCAPAKYLKGEPRMALRHQGICQDPVRRTADWIPRYISASPAKCPKLLVRETDGSILTKTAL